MFLRRGEAGVAEHLGVDPLIHLGFDERLLVRAGRHNSTRIAVAVAVTTNPITNITTVSRSATLRPRARSRSDRDRLSCWSVLG